MKQPLYAGAAAVLCHHCGGSVLTWSADRWLATHEQVFKCGGCGRMSVAPNVETGQDLMAFAMSRTSRFSTFMNKHSRPN